MIIDLAGLGYEDNAGVWSRRDQDSFGYSDGDTAEEWVRDAVLAATDRSSTSPELEARIVDWPSLYHLSSLRGNVIRPLLGTLAGPVLELGAGMGAVTRALGEAGLDVVAVEGSARRAQICAARCHDLDNVQVVCDTIAGFGQPAQFGTVIMVGVLEYSRTFSAAAGDGDPVDLMLNHVRELLTPDGQLVVAIENQLGAKYLAGFREDHLGRQMLGVEDGYGSATAVTFGRGELQRRLAAAGLDHQQWYYPWPDYKLPKAVVSEAGLDPASGFDPTSLVVGTAHQDPQEPATVTIDLAQLYPVLVRNGLLGALANSFVVAASQTEQPPQQTLAWYFGSANRLVEARKTLVFTSGPDGPRVTTSTADGTSSTEAFARGRLWSQELAALTSQPGWSLDHFTGWLDVWRTCVAELAGLDRLTADSILPGEMLDAIPRNLVVGDGRITFIDLEWADPEPLDFGFLLFRNLLDSLRGLHWIAPPAHGTPTAIGDLLRAGARTAGVWPEDAALEAYWQRERSFQQAVTGDDSAPQSVLPILNQSLRIRLTLDDLASTTTITIHR